MTVNMLIQIDKLVQLLESPVFTCKSISTGKYPASLTLNVRSPPPTPRTRTLPPPLQMPLRRPNAPPPVLRLRGPKEPSKQRQRNRLPPHRAPHVRPLPRPPEEHRD